VSRPNTVLGCYFKRRRVGAYLDGVLAGRQARAIAAHLEGCADCRDTARTLGRLRELVRSAVVTAEPDWAGFWPGIIRGIEAGPAPRAHSRPARVLRYPRAAIAGTVGAALLAVTVWQGDSPVSPAGATAVAVANTEHPDGSVMVYTPPGNDMTVIWVFGLDTSPGASSI
jgi:predicted anti-sigma-YlaC factor YlaD